MSRSYCWYNEQTLALRPMLSSYDLEIAMPEACLLTGVYIVSSPQTPPARMPSPP